MVGLGDLEAFQPRWFCNAICLIYPFHGLMEVLNFGVEHTIQFNGGRETCSSHWLHSLAGGCVLITPFCGVGVVIFKSGMIFTHPENWYVKPRCYRNGNKFTWSLIACQGELVETEFPTSPLDLFCSVLFWSLLLPPGLLLLLDVSLLVLSQIRSRQLSVSHGSWLLQIPELIISHWLRLLMSTSPPLHCATLTPHCAMWTLLSRATTRLLLCRT